MLNIPDEAEVTRRLLQWGQRDPLIRAMLLTSSRPSGKAPVDTLSDYDVILVVADTAPFACGADWQANFARPMVRFNDAFRLYDIETYARLVIYSDGAKIDYTIWPLALLILVAQQTALPEDLDVGYRVLLDKDNLTATLLPPTYKAHIPAKPSEAEYLAIVEEFWWETSYVAKNLWRDELLPAKYSFDDVMKLDCMVKIFEWRIETEHDWSLKPGLLGKWLKRRLPADIWDEFAATYVGADIAENWAALFRLCALFSRVARDLATRLNFTYPDALEAEVLAYLHDIQDLPK